MKKFLLLLGILGLFIGGNINAQQRPIPTSDILVLKNEVNITDTCQWVVFELGHFVHFITDISISGGVTCKAYVTLDESLSETDTTGWCNYNTEFFAADSITDAHMVSFTPYYFSPLKVMLFFQYSDSTNENTTILKRYN